MHCQYHPSGTFMALSTVSQSWLVAVTMEPSNRFDGGHSFTFTHTITILTTSDILPWLPGDGKQKTIACLWILLIFGALFVICTSPHSTYSIRLFFFGQKHSTTSRWIRGLEKQKSVLLAEGLCRKCFSCTSSTRKQKSSEIASDAEFRKTLLTLLRKPGKTLGIFLRWDHLNWIRQPKSTDGPVGSQQ